MTPRKARDLILHEGESEDGVATSLRKGKDPGPTRMRELIAAVQSLFNSIEGRKSIERNIAAALFALGTEVPAQLESWSRHGGVWREDLIQHEQVLLLLAIESVFDDEWLMEDPAESADHSGTVSTADDLRQIGQRQHGDARPVRTGAITVESRRKKRGKLERAVPGALIIDLTSRGDEPWVRFSPFYPHGGIPVPNAPGVFAQSVEGLWQGLKVFEHEDIDPARWQIADMRGIKRAGVKRGKVLGHRFGPGSAILLGYRAARDKIYLPAYRWVLENRLAAELVELRRESASRPLVLLDYETNADIEDLSRPLSHAALLKALLEDAWPEQAIAPE